MANIFGTEGNDDGITNAVLRSAGQPSTLYGYGGDDVLISSSRPFDPTPDVLYGGTGNDRYVLGEQGSYFIYSTPIIWVPFAADVDIHEAPSITDTNDRLDMGLAGYDIQTSMVFNGTDVIISTYARTVRLFDNYDVDSVGNLIAGVDSVDIRQYSTSSPLITHDMKLQGIEVTFVRNGTAGTDSVSGDAQGNVIDGRDGDDTLAGGGGNDFITGGEGNDLVDGGDGNDRLFGGTGADSLAGGTGDDRLSGMTGDDTLEGGTGNDIYLYSLLDGHDVITDASGSDAILFGAGITQADVAITQSGGDLLIAVGAGSVTVRGHSNGSGGRIEQLRFDDGTQIDLGADANTAPDAQDDLMSVVQGRTVSGNVFADNGNGADSDADGDALVTDVRSFTTANGGAVTIAANGAFYYHAAADFVGTDVIGYNVSDGFGGAASASISVNVMANLAPVARADQFAGTEDRLLAGNLLADNGAGADSDGNGDALTVTARTLTTARGGTVTLQANGDFVYTPQANINGVDSFSYTVNDGFGMSTAGTATIDLTPVNDAPKVGPDIFSTMTTLRKTGNVLLNDSDVDGDALAATPASFTTARGGAVSIAENGQFSYQNFDGLIGSDTFSYTVSDGKGGSTMGLASFNLTAPAGAMVGSVNDDTIVGTAANNVILSQAGKDEVYGGGGADKIYGGLGDDDLNGEAGNDQLYGGSGNDKLVGGAGIDTLVGGAGLDRLRGDAGADIFMFLRLDDGADQIDDFKLKDRDRLDVSDLLQVRFDATQHRASDFVRITEAAGVSYLDIDPDGLAGPAGFTRIASLYGVTGLTNEDALFASGNLLLI